MSAIAWGMRSLKGSIAVTGAGPSSLPCPRSCVPRACCGDSSNMKSINRPYLSTAERVLPLSSDPSRPFETRKASAGQASHDGVQLRMIEKDESLLVGLIGGAGSEGQLIVRVVHRNRIGFIAGDAGD